MPKLTLLGKLGAMSAKLAKSAPKSGIAKNVQRRDGYISKISPKTISRARMDISSWNRALKAADNVENPRRARLMNLYNDIMLDAHLSAQVEIRMQHVLATPGELKRDGKLDKEATDMFARAQWKTELDRYALSSNLHGHTLVELTTNKAGSLEVTLIPRTNVIPERGMLLLKEDDDRGVDFRNLREYGTWLLEFGSHHDYGLLNKAVPHVLFMRFAQACWSEHCEIYGIPPRVMKTNTQDPEMLGRAETMMRDMGSAAWFIIDENETFDFAKGGDTNGDVYRNLMSVCKEAISVLINGAVIGQDTVNGNRSKEESSMKVLDKIIQADKRQLEGWYNGIIIPALERIGILKPGLYYELQQEDLEKLWKQTHESMQFYDVDPKWIKDKFGIEVTGKKEQVFTQGLNADFFA